MNSIRSIFSKYFLRIAFVLLWFILQNEAFAQMKDIKRASEIELKEAGWNSSKFKHAHAYADSIGTASYILIKDDKIIDQYGDISFKYRSHSVRKSFLSALYGIYINEGAIDTSRTLYEMGISEYVELSPQELSATVKNLIMSRSGVYLPATYENEGFDEVRPDRGSYRPGEYWYYSNWDFNVAGTAFMLQTKENIFAAFKEKIADQIGMQDFKIEDCSWRYSTRSIHPAYLFKMSTRDMARFGLLFLHNGKWGNSQLIPEEWIDTSTKFHSNVVRPDGSEMPGVGYGYMWWTERSYFKEAGLNFDSGAFSANGTGTQAIYVMPKEDIVFVHRVNTDLPAAEFKSVDSNEIGELLKRILSSKEL